MLGQQRVAADLAVVVHAETRLLLGEVAPVAPPAEFEDERSGDHDHRPARDGGDAHRLAEEQRRLGASVPVAGRVISGHHRDAQVADPDLRGAKLRTDGVLADVAPTALQVLGLPQPKEMKGLGLLVK